MAILPRPRRPDPGARLFDVECECGAEFRVPYDPAAATRRDDPFLARLRGRCPWCGLRLEEIDPFGAPRGAPGPGPRGAAG
jgi:hypothetical protein